MRIASTFLCTTVVAAALLILVIAEPVGGQTPGSIAQHTSGMQRADGFIPFYWDASRGRILLEISTFDTDVLYLNNPAAAAPRSVAPPWGGRPRSRYPFAPGPPL